MAIEDYEASLKRDTRLIRESTDQPKRVNIFGFLLNINTEELNRVIA